MGGAGVKLIGGNKCHIVQSQSHLNARKAELACANPGFVTFVLSTRDVHFFQGIMDLRVLDVCGLGLVVSLAIAVGCGVLQSKFHWFAWVRGCLLVTTRDNAVAHTRFCS